MPWEYGEIPPRHPLHQRPDRGVRTIAGGAELAVDLQVVTRVGDTLDAQPRPLRRIAELRRLFARIDARFGEYDQPVGRILCVDMGDRRGGTLTGGILAEGVAIELARERPAQVEFIGDIVTGTVEQDHATLLGFR